jgi:hypothetical protein
MVTINDGITVRDLASQMTMPLADVVEAVKSLSGDNVSLGVKYKYKMLTKQTAAAVVGET